MHFKLRIFANNNISEGANSYHFILFYKNKVRRLYIVI